MKRLAWTLLALAACTGTPPPEDPRAQGLPGLDEPSERLRESDQAPGVDPVRLARTHLSQTDQEDHYVITLLREHWSALRDSAEGNLLLAQAHARVVDTLDAVKDRKLHEQQRNAGLIHARRALALDPESGPARYWMGLLLLFVADAEQSYGRLKEALQVLDEAERRAPGVDEGGPARMKGRIYEETPGFPFLGSKEKAIECFKRSLAVAPGRLRTRLWLAETYARNRQPELARAELERILGTPVQGNHPREDEDVRRQAQALREKLPPR